MTNFEFLQKYFHLQDQVSFDKLFDLSFALLGYSKTDISSLSNNSLINTVLTPDQLKIVCQKLKDLNRNPSIYFENRTDLEPLKKMLVDNGFKQDFEDSWMFYDQSVEPNEKFSCVKIVEDENDLKIFLETFDNCYQKDDPQNPYGDVKGFLTSSRNSWLKHKGTERLEYYLAFKDNKPVAVSALNSHEKIGYISSVGSLKEVRGEGFGKIATLFAVFRSQKLGNDLHCLATEEGTYPNGFYKRIGFKTKFTAPLYTKNKTS